MVRPTGASATSTSSATQRAGVVLVSLIAVAAVANLALAVANVVLPSIGETSGGTAT